MDLHEFRHTLLQIVESYQRCGLAHIPRAADLPKTWLDNLELARTLQISKDKPQSVISVNAGSPSSVPQLNLAKPAPITATIRTNPVSPPRAAVGAWNLPLLDAEDRVRQFAEIEKEVKSCRLCTDIVCYRQQTVFGAGLITPQVCFMGEAPGADEDKQGTPFVGRAGQLLTKIIEAMQLKRDAVYILNSLKCRPPLNRTPTQDEIDNCHPFVERQLEVLQPKYIVCLGAVAVRSLLGITDSIGRLRGRFFSYRGAQVVVTYHPSYLLRNESAKKLVWEDMKMLMRELGLPLNK